MFQHLNNKIPKRVRDDDSDVLFFLDSSAVNRLRMTFLGQLKMTFFWSSFGLTIKQKIKTVRRLRTVLFRERGFCLLKTSLLGEH